MSICLGIFLFILAYLYISQVSMCCVICVSHGINEVHVNVYTYSICGLCVCMRAYLCKHERMYWAQLCSISVWDTQIQCGRTELIQNGQTRRQTASRKNNHAGFYECWLPFKQEFLSHSSQMNAKRWKANIRKKP